MKSFSDHLSEAGLWDNIHAKQQRIKNGSGEKMRKPGSKGAPTAAALQNAKTNEEFDISEDAAAGLAAKASKSGISIGTLRKVYNRGMAAWNSGHRPGTTPQQWAMARVNSYISKGSGTYGGADKDLHEEEILEGDTSKLPRVAKDKESGLAKKYVAGLSADTAKARAAHFAAADKLTDSNPAAYTPAPGDATAKTKESKYTKKYHAMYGENWSQKYKKSIDCSNPKGFSQKAHCASLKLKEAKDAHEYGYEGEMTINQLKTAQRCAQMLLDVLKPDTDMPEWVQSKITLAADYIQTSADYMYSEMDIKEETESKNDVPFDGPYTKTKPVKNSDGTIQSPISRARELAKQAMLKKPVKEDIEPIDELSNDLLGRYKKKAGEQASDADKAGDYAKGNKRFKGIVKATTKQFDNDLKKEDVEAQFDLIESVVEELAFLNNLDSEYIWEQFEQFTDEELLEYAVDAKGYKSSTGGLTQKGRDAYNSKGAHLKAPVTTSPSKLKAGSKAANRRKSFCARMSGVDGPMKKPNGEPSRKALALRKWNC